MPKTKVQKTAAVDALQIKVSDAEAMFVVAPKAINPNEASALKMSLSEVGAEFHVIKNSLFKLALEKNTLPFNSEYSTGQHAVVFTGKQSSEAAKIVSAFIKKSQKAEFVGGYLQGKAITAANVEELASLPSREIMLAKVLGTMQAPISGFVRVLGANISGFVNVVNAIKDQKAA